LQLARSLLLDRKTVAEDTCLYLLQEEERERERKCESDIVHKQIKTNGNAKVKIEYVLLTPTTSRYVTKTHTNTKGTHRFNTRTSIYKGLAYKTGCDDQHDKRRLLCYSPPFDLERAADYGVLYRRYCSHFKRVTCHWPGRTTHSLSATTASSFANVIFVMAPGVE
jgi:hypothetical protein